MNDADRIRIVMSFLLGGPLQWHATLFESNTLPATWNEYLHQFRTRFGLKATQHGIRDRINALQQRGTLANVHAYNSEFDRLQMLQQGMDEGSLVSAYIRGLGPKLRPQVVPNRPETVREAMELATLIDAAMNNSADYTPATASSTAAPMEINFASGRLAPLTDEERTRLRKEGRCFRCRQLGHISKDCPSAGKRPNGRRP
jgi:hypothetical protein